MYFLLFFRYEHIVETRKLAFNKLLTQQNLLCKSLDKKPKFLKDDMLPSQVLLNELQEYVEELETENFQRLEKYSEMRFEILEIVSSLKYTPVNDIERIVCDPGDKGNILVLL